VEILEVDCESAPDTLLRELYDAEIDAIRELQGAEPPPSFEERLQRLRNPSTAVRRRWLARIDGLPAGVGELNRYAPGFAVADVRVRFSHRRRGVGTALFHVVRGAAVEAGLASFFGHHATEAGAAFAARVGSRDDQREIESVLRLREVELPEPVMPDGIELRTWRGPVPDALVESFARARSAMSDAPTPGGAEWPAWTVEAVRTDEWSVLARGLEPLTTVALTGGEIVALTGIRAGSGQYAGTDDTATAPSHRGRGLAYLVKLENLRLVRELRPEVEIVGTMNAENNAAMRAVNEKLGFVPVLTLTSTVVALG
jgi:GNAT superfamily N-acetyltransferase